VQQSDWKGVLDVVGPAALEHLQSLPQRRVYPEGDHATIRAALDHGLPDTGVDPAQVVAELVRDLGPYVTAHAGGRFFGFVIGGLHPAAWGADVLVSTWDQNAGLFPPTPGVAVAEELAGEWLVDLLQLPEGCSVGFVTGGQMANFTCLAAARDQVLRDVGWDVEADGLNGAPPITVVLKEGVHSTVPRALRFLGLGERSAGVRAVRRPGPGAAGGAGRRAELGVGPDDPHRRVRQREHRRLRRLHRSRRPGRRSPRGWPPDLDARRRRRHAARRRIPRHGRAHPRAVPAGLVVDRRAQAAQRPVRLGRGDLPERRRAPGRDERAGQLPRAGHRRRDPMDWNPEFSRRARGVAVYAALRSLGRQGVADLVDRTSRLARRFAEALTASGLAEVVNDVVSNQVLVRWLAADGDGARLTEHVMAAVRAEGTAFFSGTTYRGERLMRISVSDWATDEADVDRVVEALLRAARESG
jgi:glutamate/tyrosine decarboxylase-like PLP-dependent enzyme